MGDEAPSGVRRNEGWAYLPGLLGFHELGGWVGGVAWKRVPLPLSPCQCAFARCTECTTVHSVPSVAYFIRVPAGASVLSMQAKMARSQCVCSSVACALIFNWCVCLSACVRVHVCVRALV